MTATFVDNTGVQTPNSMPYKINDGTFVFGATSSGSFKMVAVDAAGSFKESRYMSSSLASDVMSNWASATQYSGYSVTNVHIAVSCTSNSERPQEEQFNGNTDRNTKVRQDFDLVSARYVRIYVKTWNGANFGMRAGVVVPAEQFPFGSIRDIHIGPMPTVAPTHAPTAVPTSQAPTRAPTNMPSNSPSYSPTAGPTFAPSFAPSYSPSYSPTYGPTFAPSYSPSYSPTYSPSYSPSFSPSYSPSMAPTPIPSFAPTVGPTFAPTNAPTYTPTHAPTTAAPSFTPTYSPTFTPTKQPTPPPSFAPTTHPTAAPSLAPTPHPTSARQMCMCDAPLAARLPEDEGARLMIVTLFNVTRMH